jgi:hypothetical protein
MSEELVPYEAIENKIYLIRGQKVMLDDDLAQLYGVPTKRFNEQVRRNVERFPEDFMFQITKEEWENLRFQFGTLNEAQDNKNLRLQNAPLNEAKDSKILRSQFATSSYGGRRYLPFAFTEHGILMLSSVLRSPSAIQVNIAIMRAFVRLRQVIATHKDLATKIDLLEKRVFKHDSDIRELVRDIRKLTLTKTANTKKMGFLK